MNIQVYFEQFLDKVVNLNKARVDRIGDAQRILSEFIKTCDDFKDIYIDTIPQGSFRQGTIIKPIGEQGTFDVDLLVTLEEKPSWTATDYLTKLSDAFKESGVYEDITDTNGKTRCVTIDYKGDFHVDLVPAIQRQGNWYICNKTTGEFEKTDGDGYAQWFEQQNLLANGHLVEVVRLLKYLRDSGDDFDTKSIILTTIAGNQVEGGEGFTTLPESFTSVVVALDSYLNQFEIPPSVHNPAMPGETFDRHWKDDQSGFEKFKSSITRYARLATEASSISDSDEAVKAWRKLFGENFGIDNDKGMPTSYRPVTPIGSSMSSPFRPTGPYAQEK